MATFYFDNVTSSNTGGGNPIYNTVTSTAAGTTLNSGNQTSTLFAEWAVFQATAAQHNQSTGTFDISVDVASASGTVAWRARLQHVDSGETVQANSSYTSSWSGTGVNSTTVTFAPTWTDSDRLWLSVEYDNKSGHGNVSWTFNTDDTQSFFAEPAGAGPQTVNATVTPMDITPLDASAAGTSAATVATTHAAMDITVLDATAAGSSVSSVNTTNTPVPITVLDVSIGVPPQTVNATTVPVPMFLNDPVAQGSSVAAVTVTPVPVPVVNPNPVVSQAGGGGGEPTPSKIHLSAGLRVGF